MFLQLESSNRRSTQTEDYHPLPPGSEAHWEVVERILFIYAKLNPGQSYVQGMNEIIGPIYYTFANDPSLAFRGTSTYKILLCIGNITFTLNVDLYSINWNYYHEWK